MQQERITETFRGLNCKKHARQWRDQKAREGWAEENFSGVSGVGGYKTCSMTLVRSVETPVLAGNFCPACGAPAQQPVAANHG